MRNGNEARAGTKTGVVDNGGGGVDEDGRLEEEWTWVAGVRTVDEGCAKRGRGVDEAWTTGGLVGKFLRLCLALYRRQVERNIRYFNKDRC